VSPSGATRERSPVPPRPHVLLISDDPGLKAFLEEGLIIGGFWFSQVGSAIQALEVFRLRSFDLVLLDAALGGIGALELLRRLRGRSDRAAGDQPRTDVPILAIAASTEELGWDDARIEGANGLLFAPIQIEELVPRLFREIEAWRAAHPDRPWSDEQALGVGR
jgi:DNA-binding response OmpR family regulator